MSESILNVQLVDQRVTRLSAELQGRFTDELGIQNDQPRLKSAAFVFLVARILLELSEDEALDGIVEGGGDFGIDAIYFGPPDDGEFSITLIQGKYRQNLGGVSQFPENGIVKVCDAIRTIFNPATQFTANDRLRKRIEEVRSIVSEGFYPQIRVILCNNGPKWNSAAQQRIDGAGFGDLVSWRHIGPDELSSLMRARKSIEAKLQLSGRALVEDHPYMRAMIGRMSVVELASLFEKNGDSLLERNIRRYLGLIGRVNEEIAATLRDESQRSNFYFYNNGITMICNKFRYNPLSEKDWIVQVDGLQIVNGGQTSKTIEAIKSEIGPEISSAYVLVRLYELAQDDEELVQRITRATNSQNPVDLRDLRSNDSKQNQLAEMIQELGYAYRRQRSSGAALASDITNSAVAESVLAVWRRRPHQARFMTTEHFGKLYDQIFTNDLNGAQAIIAVLVLRFAENRRKRPPQGAPEFLQYGSRFIAMLMGIYLLSDLGIQFRDLDHKNFEAARKMLEGKSEAYFQKAVEQIRLSLNSMHDSQSISLQKLSATFRRGDLVASLIGQPLTVEIPNENLCGHDPASG